MGVGSALRGLAGVAQAQGHPERAVRLLGSSQAVWEIRHAPQPEQTRAAYEAVRRSLRKALDEAALETAWAEGHTMSLERAVSYALARSEAIDPGVAAQ